MWWTIVDPAFDESDAVMARIDVEEIGRKRPQPIIAELEAEHVLVKRHHIGDALEMHHHVPHAQRTGAKAGNVAAGLERIAGGFRAVKNLQPVAGGIVEHDQIRHVSLVGECTGPARDLGAGGLDAGRDGVERGTVRHLPAEKGDALSAVGVDHESLLAVIHAKRKRRTALVDAL
jgi:hypothetical protein